jgi:hypothetical protein
VHVMNSELSTTDTGSELETGTGQRGADKHSKEVLGADGSHDEQGRADMSNKDEKKLRVDSPAISDYNLC